MDNTNIKSYPWVIFFDGESERKAVVDWLYDQGYTNVPAYPGDVLYTNVYVGEDTELAENPLRSAYSYYNKICKEIKLTFKTKATVVSVEYPVLESEKDRQIRELKEAIDKAQKQIEELQKME